MAELVQKGADVAAALVAVPRHFVMIFRIHLHLYKRSTMGCDQRARAEIFHLAVPFESDVVAVQLSEKEDLTAGVDHAQDDLLSSH